MEGEIPFPEELGARGAEMQALRTRRRFRVFLRQAHGKLDDMRASAAGRPRYRIEERGTRHPAVAGVSRARVRVRRRWAAEQPCNSHAGAPVPLCWMHHRAYDTGGLELLPHLEPQWRAEVAHAVSHLGLIGAVRRLAPGRR